MKNIKIDIDFSTDAQTEPLSIRDKIDAGFYRNKEPRPICPIKPDVLEKNILDLTKEEIFTLFEIREAYTENLNKFCIEKNSWNIKQDLMESRFKDDLEEEFGVKNHPKADLLYHKAWNLGHSYGLAQVLSDYENLVDIIK